jgi:hypothetical protein
MKTDHTGRWTLLLVLITLLGVGEVSAQTTPSLNIGTLPAGKSITITYEVTVNDPLPPDTTEISSQCRITGSNFSDLLTDDPNTPEPDDPTRVPADAGGMCVNICDNAQTGVALISDDCFVQIGQFGDNEEYVEALGLKVLVQFTSDPPRGMPVQLTPPPDAPCNTFDWVVWNLAGEEITDEAGEILDGTFCFSFELTGAVGYYHVEATCTTYTNIVYAFGVLVVEN